MTSSPSAFDRLVDEIGALHSKLILLIGGPGAGKTTLLAALADKRGAKVLNVGCALGKRLAVLSSKQRTFKAPALLRELADEHADGDLLLIDNIELLFDRTLKLNPLRLLKRHAQIRRVVAAWPGELEEGRLTYAEIRHPEYQDYPGDDLVPFEMKSVR